VLLEAIVAAQHRCNFMPFISLFDESILSSRQAARSSGESARRRQVRVDLAPDIRRGEACDFRNRFRVQTLEIRHDHLAVERIELLDQSEQSAERLGTVRRTFNVFGTRVALGLFQGQKGSYTLALGLADDVRRRHVVRHTVSPGSKRAPPVELRQAAPQRQMDFLRKLPTQFRISFIGTNHAGKLSGYDRGTHGRDEHQITVAILDGVALSGLTQWKEFPSTLARDLPRGRPSITNCVRVAGQAESSVRPFFEFSRA